MVDFSCALKLAMPISVLSAMRECSDHHINVKGGKFLEAVSQADTIVFDKTGTLTNATPSVREVIPFGGEDADEMLRLAACLEEHFPHSIANAVVKEAERKRLIHEEKHTKVEYVVAHGIASTIDGKRALIGSYHFIFEDEKCTIPEGAQDQFDALPEDCSLLYLAVDSRLAAVICIEDPIREEAVNVVSALHDAGFSRVVMMTGDSRKTAAAVADRLGMDEFYAEVLPEDKAAFIRREHEAGRKVVMIGDGINDSPALSEADAGIAIAAGAAIAREIADITISADDLRELVVLRRLSNGLTSRIDSNYRRIMTFNGALIVMGLFGCMPSARAALLHNVSTIYFSLDSMKNLL
jgi:P-type E1-E2 ATPase